MVRHVYLLKRYPKTYGALSTVTYYDKAFLANLKANMSFGWADVKPLPEQTGDKIQMFMYKPVAVGKYADYANFSDLSLEKSVDPLVQSIAQEMATKMALSLNTLVAATADNTATYIEGNYKVVDKDGDELIEIFKHHPDGQYESLGWHKAKDWDKLKA